MKKGTRFLLNILGCLSVTVASDPNGHHYPPKQAGTYSLKTGRSLVVQSQIEGDLSQFQQVIRSLPLPSLSVEDQIISAVAGGDFAQEENDQNEPLMISMSAIRAQVASEKHQAMMTELKGRVFFLKDWAEGAETMEYVMVGKPKMNDLMRQKTTNSLAYNAQFVPAEILALVPLEVLNSCNFEPGDTDREKSIKMIRLGILIYGLSPQILGAVAINNDEKNFLSACCFKDACGLMKTHLNTTPEPDVYDGSDAHAIDRINDYALVAQAAYWSLCRLVLSGTPKTDLLIQMKETAEDATLDLQSRLFQLPERHPVREQYLEKLRAVKSINS